jgi:hypothetical protein
VADLFGYSSIAITGGVYGHSSDDTARAAVDGLAERLGLDCVATGSQIASTMQRRPESG